MSVTALVSVEEYLRTSYSDGDREYIDGRVVERNVGTTDHSHWQSRMLVFLLNNSGLGKPLVRPVRLEEV